MADVKIRIEVNPNAESEVLGDIQNQINNTSSSDNISNVSVKTDSIGIFQNIPSSSGGINGLSLAQDLIFDENGYVDNEDLQGGVLESTENPVEFIWGAVPESGEYSVKLVFTNAQNLKDIIVYGDSVVNQFPTQAIIDSSKIIYNDDLQWAINLQEESETHTIEFTHWNRVNYNACLSYIAVMMKYLDIDKYTGLKSVESLSQSSSDTTGIFYGVLENSGSLELLDRTDELDDLLSDGVIDNSNTKVEIIANGKSVQHHISTDSSYDRNTKLMSLELGNRFNSLDILKYKGYDYPDHSERLSVLFFDVLSNLRYALFGTDKALTQEEFKEMLSGKYDSSKTLYDYLYSIEVEYPLIEENKTYREVIDEFCLVAQMQMYIDDDDNVRFVSARPKVFDEDFKAINIPKKNMFSQLDYAVVLKNKYDGIETSRNNVSDLTDNNSLCYGWQSNNSDSIYIESENSDVYTNIFHQTSNVIPSDIYYYAKVVLNYYETTISFDKKSNQNLIEIKDVYDGVNNYDEPYITYSVDYLHETGNLNFNYQDNANIEDMFSPNYTKVETGSSSLATYTDIKASYYSEVYGTAEAKVFDETNLKTTQIEYEGNNYDGIYSAKIKILVGYTREAGIIQRYLDDGTYHLVGDVSRVVAEKYTPRGVSINFNGVKREISFEEIQSNTENIELAKTKVSIGTSNLIQSDTVINSIKNNILKDYAQGVSNATVSISCSDYFNENHEKVIDWEKGEIPKINQIIYFDDDLNKDKTQRYWKIKGRTFRKSGVPMIDLELEEVIK